MFKTARCHRAEFMLLPQTVCNVHGIMHMSNLEITGEYLKWCTWVLPEEFKHRMNEHGCWNVNPCFESNGLAVRNMLLTPALCFLFLPLVLLSLHGVLLARQCGRGDLTSCKVCSPLCHLVNYWGQALLLTLPMNCSPAPSWLRALYFDPHEYVRAK